MSSVVSLRQPRYRRRYAGSVSDGRTISAQAFKRAYDAICDEFGGPARLSALDLALCRSVASLTVQADEIAAKIAKGEHFASSVLIQLSEQIDALCAKLRGRAA